MQRYLPPEYGALPLQGKKAYMDRINPCGADDISGWAKDEKDFQSQVIFIYFICYIYLNIIIELSYIDIILYICIFIYTIYNINTEGIYDKSYSCSFFKWS